RPRSGPARAGRRWRHDGARPVLTLAVVAAPPAPRSAAKGNPDAADSCWMRQLPRTARARAVTAAALLGLVALALRGRGSGSDDSGAAVVRVTEKDFRIRAPRVLKAGDVVLRVDNTGPDNHELIMVKADRLPLRSDGLTVDEESLQKAEAGVLEPGKP